MKKGSINMDILKKDRHGLITRTVWAYTVEVLLYDGQLMTYSIARRKRNDQGVLEEALTIRGSREARIRSLSINIVGMTPEAFIKKARVLSSKEVRL